MPRGARLDSPGTFYNNSVYDRNPKINHKNILMKGVMLL